ncbi:MAG: hypothetical protein Q8862_01910 [Bacteroidota bacterium]|nr:hypothetical protein [Bacteroidota bacterium]
MNKLCFVAGMATVVGVMSLTSGFGQNKTSEKPKSMKRMTIKIIEKDDEGNKVVLDTTFIDNAAFTMRKDFAKMADSLRATLHERIKSGRPMHRHNKEFIDDEMMAFNFDEIDSLGKAIEKEFKDFNFCPFDDSAHCGQMNIKIPHVKPDAFKFIPKDMPDLFTSEKFNNESQNGINLNDPNIISYEKTPIGEDKEKIVIIRKKEGGHTEGTVKHQRSGPVKKK